MKMTKAQWHVTALLVLGLGCLTAFQNCSSQVSFSDPAASQAGSNQDNATQSTSNPGNTTSTTNPNDPTNSNTNTNNNSNTTTNTTNNPPPGGGTGGTGTGGGGGGTTPTDPTPPSQNCGNQIEINGHCVDFQCSRVINLTSAADLQNIPARTVEGLCYSYKIADAIANSASALTPTADSEVVSRNHSGGAATRNPYLMASAKLDIKLGGGRVVKVAGGANVTSPILVDNFLLVGIYPTNTAITNWATYYSAYGTADSVVAANNAILFHNQNIALQPFGSGGTSTIAPLDIGKFIYPLTSYTLDIRAEDCGGARQLSALYLLFQ